MTTSTFCVHGHFYQPSREDPITNEIPIEPGAVPYRNWNEKIHDHCYRPNARLGNFEKISFNIGPTLVDWMAGFDPDTLGMIIAQNDANHQRNGVGNAMAQAYNHTILPLSSREDKITQVKWGMADFEFRFGHTPEGLWLPETAVDLESLEVLVDCGVKFTILAPWQTQADNLDISHPYRVEIKPGKEIIVFFYQQELSSRISFDPGASADADAFVREILLPRFNPQKGKNDRSQLIMIASDGELYGHHQPFRDKFLAYLMDGAIKNRPVERTYPSLWLKENAVTDYISIHEGTSWSCYHGVTRWMGDCDCTPLSDWKAALRIGLMMITQAVDDVYFRFFKGYLSDPWSLRHEYIQVIHRKQTPRQFIEERLGTIKDDLLADKMDLLLQAQYECQKSTSSCGWFFEELDGIGPRNVIAYAAQAVWLTRKATGENIAPRALAWLSPVHSKRCNVKGDAVFTQYLQRAQSAYGQVKPLISNR
jgi:alpha-amylase/alpha-mannosidase (GH57 family)